MGKRTRHDPEEDPFVQAAREHGCDVDPAALEQVLTKIVPPKSPKKRPRPNRKRAPKSSEGKDKG